MALPKLWRKKRGGRFVGSFHATIAGDDVNMRTTNADEAHKRLRAAVQRGRRSFDDELEGAAALEDAGTADAMKAPEAPGPDASALPAPVAAPPAPPPPQPPSAPEAGDVDDMAAAAADVAGAAANDNAAAAAAAPDMDPEVLDGMLRTGALVLVDAQLQLQAALVKRYTGKVAGVVPADSPMRAGAAEAWVAQLKIWIPADKMLPPWALALLLPTMCIPAQLAAAVETPANQGQAAA